MFRQPILLLLIFSLVITSCQVPRYIYAPSVNPTPFLEEKGDAEASVYYSGSPANSSTNKTINEAVDAQAAYAITPELAITGNFTWRNEKESYRYSQGITNYDIFDSSVVKYKRRMMEVGIGYFAALNKKKTLYTSVYTGIGLGKFSIRDQGLDDNSVGYSRMYENRMFKWYLQPVLSLHAGKWIRLAYALRFSYVRYGWPSSSYTDHEYEYFEFKRIQKRWVGFVEPSAQLQFIIPELNWLRLSGGTIFCSDPFDGNKLRSRQITFFAGLTAHFPTGKKQKAVF